MPAPHSLAPSSLDIPPPPQQLHHPYPMPAAAAGQTNWAAAAAMAAAADFADPIHHLRFGDFPFPGGLAAFRKFEQTFNFILQLHTDH